MLKLRRAYEAEISEDGFRVLVDRLWPRGLKKDSARIDLWMRDVAPSDALRKWFAHKEERWAEFAARYRKELKEKRPLLAELRDLERKHRRLTLLFAAKDEKRNNAAVLKKALESLA